jgi:pyrroline-5-carboxylate reductase
MGGALLKGWLASSSLPSMRITVIQRTVSDALRALCEEQEICLNCDLEQITGSDVVVFAVKPQQFSEVATRFCPYVTHETTILSVMTGKTLAALRRMFPQAQACVRTMPNILATVGKSITPALIDDPTQGVSKAYAQALLQAVGSVEWIADEVLLDGITAVSGSGPAYVFYLVDCLAEAGKKQGLPEDLALRLARATVAGSGVFLESTKESPSALRTQVTSPGGTTAEALSHLMNPKTGLQPLMNAAVTAACQHSRILADA